MLAAASTSIEVRRLDDVDFSRKVRGHFEADFLLADGGLGPDLHRVSPVGWRHQLDDALPTRRRCSHPIVFSLRADQPAWCVTLFHRGVLFARVRLETCKIWASPMSKLPNLSWWAGRRSLRWLCAGRRSRTAARSITLMWTPMISPQASRWPWFWPVSHRRRSMTGTQRTSRPSAMWPPV